MRAPSYKGRQPSCEAASRAKRSNRKINTTPELLLRRELSKLGLRFRNNVKTLAGTPDIVFIDYQVAVFCDGDFWHGRNWARLRRNLERRHNAEYWVAKIAANRRRDRLTTHQLTQAGWLVLRIWETDIRRDAASLARKLAATVATRRDSHRRIRAPVSGESGLRDESARDQATGFDRAGARASGPAEQRTGRARVQAAGHAGQRPARR